MTFLKLSYVAAYHFYYDTHTKFWYVLKMPRTSKLKICATFISGSQDVVLRRGAVPLLHLVRDRQVRGSHRRVFLKGA